jgi:hypothetical protein
MYVAIHTFWILEETKIWAFCTEFSSTALRTGIRGSHVFVVTGLAKQIIIGNIPEPQFR